MGWLIICSVIWVIIVILIFFNCNDDVIGQSIAAFIIIAIVGGLTQIIASEIISSKKSFTEFKPLYIESAFSEKNWKINGGFIVGTGRISGGSYTDYIVYGKFYKGLRRIKLSTYNTYIKENSNITPQIENYWIKRTELAWESWLWFVNEETEIAYFRNNTDLIMIVPENTVYKSFELK